MSRLVDQSFKGKSKLYFRDSNPEQECEKESHLVSLKSPFSRDCDEAEAQPKGLPNLLPP